MRYKKGWNYLLDQPGNKMIENCSRKSSETQNFDILFFSKITLISTMLKNTVMEILKVTSESIGETYQKMNITCIKLLDYLFKMKEVQETLGKLQKYYSLEQTMFLGNQTS